MDLTPDTDEIALVVAWLRTQGKMLPSAERHCNFFANAIERGAHLNNHEGELTSDVLALVDTRSIADDADKTLLAAAAQQVCRTFNVHPRDLLGRYRYGFLMPARFALYAVLVAAGWSRKKVGRMLDRDHSALRHGLARAADMARRDPVYAKKLNAVTAAVLEKTT